MFDRSLRRVEIGDLAIEELAPLGAIALRGRTDDRAAMDAFAAELGEALPEPGTAWSRSETVALWMMPDQWLLILPRHRATDYSQRLRSATAGVHAAAVDVSDALCCFALSGDKSEEVLGAGSAVAVSAEGLRADRCLRTSLALVDVTLIPVASPRKILLVTDRPSGPYLWEWLVDTAQGVAS